MNWITLSDNLLMRWTVPEINSREIWIWNERYCRARRALTLTTEILLFWNYFPRQSKGESRGEEKCPGEADTSSGRIGDEWWMYSGRGKRGDQKEYNDPIAAWDRRGDIWILNILRFAEILTFSASAVTDTVWGNSNSLNVQLGSLSQRIAKCSKSRYLLACSTQLYGHYILFDRSAFLFPNTFTIHPQYILTKCQLLPVTFPHFSFPLYFPAENNTKTAISPSSI